MISRKKYTRKYATITSKWAESMPYLLHTIRTRPPPSQHWTLLLPSCFVMIIHNSFTNAPCYQVHAARVWGVENLDKLVTSWSSKKDTVQCGQGMNWGCCQMAAVASGIAITPPVKYSRPRRPKNISDNTQTHRQTCTYSMSYTDTLTHTNTKTNRH